MLPISKILAITIAIAVFCGAFLPIFGDLGPSSGGGTSDPQDPPPGPSYLTYTNEGRTMARITPETTPTINVAVTPTGVSINETDVEIAAPAIVVMSQGLSSQYPGLCIAYANGKLSLTATVVGNTSVSTSSTTQLSVTAQGEHWYVLGKELACTDAYVTSDTGDYVNVPMGTAAYVPADDRVATAYIYGNQVAITYFVPSEYVGYYKGTVEEVPGAVKLTQADNDMGKVIGTLVPKTVVTDIETEAPEPPADDGPASDGGDGPVWTMIRVIPLMIVVSLVLGACVSIFRRE